VRISELGKIVIVNFPGPSSLVKTIKEGGLMFAGRSDYPGPGALCHPACRLDPKLFPKKAKKRFGQVGPGTMRTNGRKS